MVKKSKTPSRKKQKIVEEEKENDEEEEVDIVGGLAEAPQGDEAGTSAGGPVFAGSL